MKDFAARWTSALEALHRCAAELASRHITYSVGALLSGSVQLPLLCRWLWIGVSCVLDPSPPGAIRGSADARLDAHLSTVQPPP